MSTAVLNTSTAVESVSALAASGRSDVAVRVPSAAPRLRLTKRGRVVFTTLASLPVVAAVMFFALNGGGATATSSSGAALEEITLQAGQSLWQLAEDIAPHDDPRDVISDIMAVNQLESGSVQAGQRLMLPPEYSAE
ncbi:hypothetical protein ABIE21_000461 [Conyzicola nivalis]|uniref:LysM domain-containing protein n=1 Tax=Conyzicola nivalis TaxID=1477021 RepID=A0ABV2QIU7_9MICO